jgi:transcriptional regulator with XRE-family HTH domain
MLHPVPTEPPVEPDTVDARPQRPQPAAPPPELDPAWRAGRKLAEARRQRGWSLEEVADRIRVRREFLEALEDMNIKLLPGKAYALAFLRSYARELGVDEKAIVDQFQDECALTRDSAQPQIRPPTSRPRKERPWLLAAGLVVLAAIFVGWRAVGVGLQDEPISEQVAVAPAPPPSAAPAPAPVRGGAEARVVEIMAVSEAWLEARGPDGTVFLSRTLQPGDVYRPDASPGWTLHARDGGAFELYVNGASAGLLGTAGMPVLGRAIDGIQPLATAQVTPPRS